MRVRYLLAAVALALLGGGIAQGDSVRVSSSAAAGSQPCERRLNDTLAKVEACITRATLWHDLSRFQRIADAHPDEQGHGNRDTGTPGYAASVSYVAGVMRRAGYRVTIQRYAYRSSEMTRTPEMSTPTRRFSFERDFLVARQSPGGMVTARVAVPSGASSGCAARDFVGFRAGDVALLEGGTCDVDTQVGNAGAASASAVIIADSQSPPDPSGLEPEPPPHEVRLTRPARMPVIGTVRAAVAAALARGARTGLSPLVHIDVRARHKSGLDYNVIADAPYGDPRNVLVVDAHLDSIYGAGMLDNASGSTTILDVALAMAKTPTRNKLRYIWFGGEEIGLLGSHYYARHLTPAERRRIAFDIDVDVTATPNFDVLVADPKNASDADRFPPNVVPQSRIGNDAFYDYFQKERVVARPAWFGNNGTDSNAFGIVGIPNSGILTQQDCCKHLWETRLWGGVRGNYEGAIPSFNGGCVDRPHRWCDNLSNNDPFVLELVSKSVAYVAFTLAQTRGLP